MLSLFLVPKAFHILKTRIRHAKMGEVLKQRRSAEQDRLGVRYSIVITCCNQHEFIKDAVESVLSQGHSSKEVIVVDDGSKDGSLEVLKRYENSIDLLAL